MGSSLIHKYPLLRVLIPMLGGIYFTDQTLLSKKYTLILFLLIFFLGVILIVAHLQIKRHKKNYWYSIFGWSTLLLSFLFGCLSCLSQTTDFLTPNSTPTCYLGTISTTKIYKAESNSWQYDVLLSDFGNAKLRVFEKEGKSISSVSVGDQIVIEGVLAVPKDIKTEGVFDYKTYLRRNGYRGVLYTDSDKVKRFGETRHHSLKLTLLYWNERTQDYLKGFGLSDEAFGIVSALVLGTKVHLSNQVKVDYSTVGISHVLALSGLHVGLIFAVVTFLLRALFKWSNHKSEWCICIGVAILWLFALFTGASPSVVRASLFFTLYGIARLFKRESIGFNVLLSTSFIMLLIHPYWLFDVGFQLSFSAVMGILLFYPLWSLRSHQECRLSSYVYNTGILSLAAQLGTLPVILYYFGTFPIYFLLSNLIVIPLITLVLYLSVLLIIVGWLPYVYIFIAFLINQIISLMNMMVACMAQWPTFLNQPFYISFMEVGLLSIVILSLWFLLSRLTYKRMLLLLVSVLILVSIVGYRLFLSPVGVGIGTISSRPFLHVVGRNYSSIFLFDSGDTDWVFPRIGAAFERYWSLNSIKKPTLISGGDIHFYDSLMVIGNYSVLYPSKEMERMEGDEIIEIDYLYVDRRNWGYFTSIIDNVEFKSVIVHESLDVRNKKEVEAYAKAKNIEIITLSEKAYVWFVQ